MTDEEIVTALAEVLHDEDCDCEERPCLDGRDSHYTRLAADLLPVVRRVAEQRAAEELLFAADMLGRGAKADNLSARAAALTATPNHGTDAT